MTGSRDQKDYKTHDHPSDGSHFMSILMEQKKNAFILVSKTSLGEHYPGRGRGCTRIVITPHQRL